MTMCSPVSRHAVYVPVMISWLIRTNLRFEDVLKFWEKKWNVISIPCVIYTPYISIPCVISIRHVIDTVPVISILHFIRILNVISVHRVICIYGVISMPCVISIARVIRIPHLMIILCEKKSVHAKCQSYSFSVPFFPDGTSCPQPSPKERDVLFTQWDAVPAAATLLVLVLVLFSGLGSSTLSFCKLGESLSWSVGAFEPRRTGLRWLRSRLEGNRRLRAVSASERPLPSDRCGTH